MYYYLAQNCVWERGIVLLVWVCLSVFLSVIKITQKVLDRFRWNLAGSLVIIKWRSSSILTRISQIERKPRPKQISKMPYLKKFSTDIDEIWQEAWLSLKESQVRYWQESPSKSANLVQYFKIMISLGSPCSGPQKYSLYRARFALLTNVPF